MKKLKNFFDINERFRFEWGDLCALLTIANVALIILGFWWAPVVGLVNCGLGIGLAIAHKGHINTYAINLALIALNIFFLK